MTVLTRIHNIGHIHNTIFAQTQFSRSTPQKTHFLKSWEFTFLLKYLVCGFKIEISEYPTKVLYVTYSPYKYELHRTKTHEIRAKYFRPFFFPHCSFFLLFQKYTRKASGFTIWKATHNLTVFPTRYRSFYGPQEATVISRLCFFLYGTCSDENRGTRIPHRVLDMDESQYFRFFFSKSPTGDF